jgi:hypothetical protein
VDAEEVRRLRTHLEKELAEQRDLRGRIARKERDSEAAAGKRA